MKKNTYTHLPRVNQEANKNLVTKNMILSKSFNIKSLKMTASCLLSSIVAIAILGIANKSVAQDENGRPGIIAVMRLSEDGEFLFIRRKPTILETVDSYYQNLENIEDKPMSHPQPSVVGKLEYRARGGDNVRNKYYLYPTTIVKLSGCKKNGWCRLEQIIYNQGNQGEEWKDPNYEKSFNYSSFDRGEDSLSAWVPSSNFCELSHNEDYLLDCSVQTKEMVYSNPNRNVINAVLQTFWSGQAQEK